ncbi:polysaccharide biosynthesis/export family protein [Sulfuriroseicoccus oceanibius]|uniref:SLBB domain-containing protein n=1 Tax=Sulfuriroseicoccus oceanibius TaxID=2707525 RepID=A0A6B3LCN1_9BACT|nr:SLBB domain-containing protein [Sulfuriroseicoccus oceanibius]QQL45797.1 SLBB domain-containing protein [Sulfuriroseicoccus oceanibius]
MKKRTWMMAAIAMLVTVMGAFAQAPTVRVGDAVTITIRGVPETESARVSGVYKVDQNGELVGLPYLDGHRINAAGMTEGQLSRKIANAYRSAQIYTKATITALVDQPKQVRTVTVGGKVTNPGPVAYSEGMTLYEAVMAAKGPTRFGSMKKVVLMRGGGKTVFNLENDQAKQVTVLPGDTILIEKKGAFEL